MSKINWYWKCEFIGGDGKSIWKIVAASTPLGAKKRCFEVGFQNHITPKYDTIRPATDKEIREFKKEIKSKINKQ